MGEQPERAVLYDESSQLSVCRSVCLSCPVS